jgi:tetratricopeptide (TPR) repeat protein
VSLIVCTAIGALAKESAVMLPLYAAWVEITITHARDCKGRWSRPVLALYACVLALPLLFGLVWLAGWMHGPQTYGRSFDAIERLLTEARVLVDYIAWTLAPSLDALTLYHDDIAVSHGLLDPPATLVSIITLATIFAAALWQRHRRPLFALGIFWFFSGHLLTATVVPLLLAFEHRNYFSSAGLLLAGASVLALEGPLQKPAVRAALAACVFAFYAGTTFLRAGEWSEPMKWIMSEAAKRPNSPGAQYERASAMLAAARGAGDGRMINVALLLLEKNRHLPDAGINYEQLLITTSAKSGRPIDPAWWSDMVAKLRAKPPNASDAKSLANLNGCFITHICKDDVAVLQQSFDAALVHGQTLPSLLQVYAEFAWYLLGDQALAEQQLRAVVSLLPKNFDVRFNLAVAMIARGELDEARAEVDAMRQLNRFGLFDKSMLRIEKALKEKAQESAH